MYQLTVEVIDSLLELGVVKQENISAFSFQHFQPMFVLIFALVWVSLRQMIVLLFPKANANRIIGLSHAISMVMFGIPVLNLLTSNSYSYQSMFDAFIENYASLLITGNIMCYASIGYFLMDSYFLVRKTYLKHHIGAIITWLFTAYHHETSLVHGAVCISLFELGAILVQLSRVSPNNLIFRTLICCGYTSTRLSLAWYYGFIAYTFSIFFPTAAFHVQAGYIPIFTGLIFLIILNAKWTMMQWRALISLYIAHFTNKESTAEDFFTFHQRIIGNSTPATA